METELPLLVGVARLGKVHSLLPVPLYNDTTFAFFSACIHGRLDYASFQSLIYPCCLLPRLAHGFGPDLIFINALLVRAGSWTSNICL